MTLSDVAEAADVSVAYLSKVELGQKEPTLKYVSDVASAITRRMRAIA